MRIPSNGLLTPTTADLRPGALAPIPFATGAQLLSDYYQRNLISGLTLASVVLAAGLAIYWGASAIAPVAPPPREIVIDVAAFTPQLVEAPPVESLAPASSVVAVGVPRPAPDHQVVTDPDIRLQSDVSPVPATDVGATIGVIHGEPVRTSVLPPDPVQVPPVTVTTPEVFVTVEQMPELIGGLAAIRPEYPDLERRIGTQGRVLVQFIVNEDGGVSDVVVTRGVSTGLDRAAVEAVEHLRFRPGVQAGRPVKVRFALPINFVLR